MVITVYIVANCLIISDIQFRFLRLRNLTSTTSSSRVNSLLEKV